MSDPLDHEGGEGGEGGDAVLAAEYALGVLDGRLRRTVERRMLRDGAFAATVEAWNARLSPMTVAISEAEPPAGLWQGIEADLNRMTRARPPAAAAAVPDVSRGRRVSAVWQYLGLGGMGLAVASLAGLLLVVAGPPRAMPGEGALTATLASQAGAPLFTVVIDRASATATLIPVAGSAGAGQVPELWLLAPGGAAPESLGLLDADRPLRLVIRNAGLEAPDAALAVSLEPEGGSPTGLPTGPVVATGALRSV